MFGLKAVKHILFPKKPLPGVILMYHHIREEKIDPWEVCVSEKHFAQQLEVLQKAYDVHPLADLPQALWQDTSGRKKVFITFDDGYQDNGEAAVPLLRQYGFTATFFIPTQILDGSPYFWWEMVDELFWADDKLPEQINLSGERSAFNRLFPGDVFKRNTIAETEWSANTMPPPSARCSAYLELCDWIKQLACPDQQAVSLQLMQLLGSKDIINSGKMSGRQLKVLADEGFDIGAHSIHHPALGLQTADVQQHEIAGSKRQLEDLLQKPVTTFAYPHGHFNQDTLAIMQRTGLTLACTTEGGGVYQSDQLLTLPRMWVKNVNGSDFQRALESMFNQ